MKENVKEYYEKEASVYNEEFYLKREEYPTLRYRHNYILHMISEISLPDTAKILDVGCGPGEMIKDLAKHNWKIYGVDIAKEMVEIASERINPELLNKGQVVIGEGDIENLQFEDDLFDVIICSGVIEYLKDDILWLKEISRVLKTNGYLIINITNKYSVRKWTTPFVEFIKSKKNIYNALNLVKEKILHKGKLHYFPFRSRVHSPNGFDNYMYKNNFQKIKHHYFDFAIFPAPFDTLLSFFTTPLRKKMEYLSEKNMLINGTGYLVLYKKKN